MEKIGVLLSLGQNMDFKAAFQEAKDMGLSSCQLCCWDPTRYTDENAKKINEAKAEVGFEVSLLWAGYTGPCEWNFIDGPGTIGLVPREYRAMRLGQIEEASRFAQKIGVTDIATHVGFIPENPNTTDYRDLISSLRWLCKILKSRGQNFLFETGQETPVTVLRSIQDIGTGNAYINFDTANVMLYGKGNPVDAIRVFGKYVRNTHIKDGGYPEDGNFLGKETKVGEGLADFHTIVKMLKDCGYEGPFTIEREISGEQQKKDILDTIDYLKGIFETL